MLTRIWIRGRKYYLYGIYQTRAKAYEMAKKMRKTNKTRYFILETEQGLWFPEKKYKLYLSKVQKIW